MGQSQGSTTGMEQAGGGLETELAALLPSSSHGPSTFHPYSHLHPWVNLNQHPRAELTPATRRWEWGWSLAAWLLLHLRGFERECIFGALKINCFCLRPIPFKSSTEGGQWDAAGQIFCP